LTNTHTKHDTAAGLAAAKGKEWAEAGAKAPDRAEAGAKAPDRAEAGARVRTDRAGTPARTGVTRALGRSAAPSAA
jgi:hypothetical protein